ncbi:MAG: winged helix-turn-helix domain-containing protein [Candidatus Nanoarchaeia archaeon]|nr:winged helix-turn-helix domain-containing protein [Candidatus Nanoarchaeia archaeon]
MAERRNRLEIIYDILKSIQDKRNMMIKPTHLLYKSNLSHDGMKRYIDELKASNMIMETEDPKTKNKMFTLTEKGLKFLEEYNKVRAFTDSFGI